MNPRKPPTRSETSALAVPSMVSGLNFAGVPIAVCSFDHPVAGGVHPALPKYTPTDSGPCRSMMSCRRCPGRPGRRPRSCLQLAVQSHQRAFETIRMMVHLPQRTALRAGVAVRERVVVVAADANHLVTLDVDEDAADRGADATETTHRFHSPITYSRYQRSTITN